MTTEQQRIAIAEWIDTAFYLKAPYCPKCRETVGKDEISGIVRTHHSKCGTEVYYTSPDYPNDLNAVSDAEKKLTDIETVVYMRHLCSNSTEHNENNSITVGEARHMCFATAAQRSEALCRTLWPERYKI